MMKVAVLGARGHTGRMLVPALEARGLDVRPHGRDVDATRAEEARAALRDVDAVANLAGPFLATGDTVVREAIARGIPYVDTTGEQAFMMMISLRYHSEAERARAPIVQALAYEYALVDLVVAAHLPDGADALHVLYRSRGAQGSRGTKRSVLRVLGAPALGFEGGALVRDAPARHARRFATADGPRDGVSFPGGEVLTIPRHAAFRTIRTYVPSRRPALARALAPLAGLALRGPVLRAAEAWVERRHAPPRNGGVRAQIMIETEAPARRIVVRVGDPYRVTAEVCAEGVAQLLARPSPGGWLAPAEAFDASMMLDALSRRVPGFAVEEDEKRK